MLNNNPAIYEIGQSKTEQAPELEALPLLRDYLIQRERALITELREVQRLLGKKQSVPKRERPR